MEMLISNYADLLKRNLAYYEFTTSVQRLLQERGISLLRHDLDMSVHRAKKIAQVEASLGIKSVYFIQLNSWFYNVFEIEIRRLVHEILGMGHTLGLHFDGAENPSVLSDPNMAEQMARKERIILENLFAIKVEHVSFHNPTHFMFDLKQHEFFAEMLNVYHSHFQQNFAYCSDSNGIWRHQRLDEFMVSNRHKQVQILTHPEWWTERSQTPFEKVKSIVEGRRDNVLNSYLSLLEKYGRPII